jgi:multidrug efflux system outer membrane protein
MEKIVQVKSAMAGIRYLFAVLAILMLMGGCTFIPELEEKEFPAPPRYPGGEGYDPALMNESEAAILSGLAWEDFFRDGTVKTLINTGLENNRDFKTAALAIDEARARYGIERSRVLPDAGADASYSRQRTPGSQSSFLSSDTTAETYRATLGITAYEFDLFGRLRSLSEAALNEYFATEAARESVRVTLIADIAFAYIDYRADQALLALANETVRSRRDSYDLIRLQAEEGVASELDLRQAETLLHAARVDRYQYINAVALDLNVLRLLLGTPEAMPDLTEPVDLDALFTNFVSEIPAGLPSALLTSRPDIAQAEYALKAANASIGAARAAFLPTVSLTALGGYAAAEFSGLFDGGSRYWQFSPQVKIPIFTAGRLKNSLDLAEIRKHEAVLEYERAIETAFREVADALSAVSTYDDRVQAQADLVEATKETTRLSQLRYDAGVESYLNVLDAKRQLYSARQGVIRQKASEVKAKISLYRAVGGGRGQLPRGPQSRERK